MHVEQMPSNVGSVQFNIQSAGAAYGTQDPIFPHLETRPDRCRRLSLVWPVRPFNVEHDQNLYIAWRIIWPAPPWPAKAPFADALHECRH